ncbi:MAG TPA: lipid-binding SYLF domain-containing protein [Pyrinomonadaceae bacterium]|mgnify:FL=1|nr:lipid-binding SYLF domain-containing protein [Pyrinomonadaceae bacterium]
MRSRFIALVLIMAGIAAFGSETFAQKKGKELKAAEERVDKASAVVRDVMRINEKAIPRDLLAKAKAIVVFPGALKFGFILGGQGGEGVVIRRLANGWSAPAFMNMAGGSIGAQIGGQKTDYVLLIMNEKGLKGLLEDKFEIGGEGSVSAGPVGRTAAASTNVTLDAEILSYSRSRGLFAGVALKGVVIKQDESINQAIYQKSAKEILGGTGMEWSSAPVSLQEFSKLVATYAK